MLEDLFSKVKARVTFQTGESAGKMSVPTNLLFKCPRCDEVVFMEAFEQNNKVCTACGYHSRLTAYERLAGISDENSFSEYDAGMSSLNPIGFKDYTEKLNRIRDETGLCEAIITGECHINGHECVIGIMDSRFMMASMGSVVGEKITRVFEQATDKRLPVILFTASGGARMQEGIISLMQMAKTAAAAARHNNAGLLYITVLTDPTTGGVTASFASLGDIIIAEPKVLIGFAGRRVIEDTIKQRLPSDFQSAEFLRDHGFVDMIVERKNLKTTLANLLKLHCERGI